MRISDWSSDVCSSDLRAHFRVFPCQRLYKFRPYHFSALLDASGLARPFGQRIPRLSLLLAYGSIMSNIEAQTDRLTREAQRIVPNCRDRKRVGWGKSV